MEHNILGEALDIVSGADDNELLDEALAITKGLYDEYIYELKELWSESEADLLYALMELKSIKRKLDMFGETPKVFENDALANEKVEELLEGFFKLLPDRKSANVRALEDIYENGAEPYIYGIDRDAKVFKKY